ncbi:MAG: hypothetical protein V1928_02760 [Parcubacteria group bacterium]
MKNKIPAIFLFIALFVFVANLANGQEAVQPLKEAYIKYGLVGWQTYDFRIDTNLGADQALRYEWIVDSRELFNAPTLRYFFPKGEHIVQARVEDAFGNAATDSVKLKIDFWSLQNNWFWWAAYLSVALIILYYWAVKLIYLFNKNKISRQARQFLSILDEHGWVERMVAAHLKHTRNNLPSHKLRQAGAKQNAKKRETH